MSGRILVVDDEPAMLRAVRRVLAPAHEVLTATCAEEALAHLEQEPVLLAILDVRMKGLSGFELMGALREQQPGLDVIFMTGAVHELDDQLIRAIREKAFYFIQKPFDREVLLTLVARCLEQRRLSDQNEEYTRRLRQELDEARQFQHSLLPPASARFGRLGVQGRYLPCDELGGDLFDYLDAGGGRATALIADVAGHGVSAAMWTAIVKSAFHDAGEESWRPRSVVRRIAQSLRPFAEEKFVTLFCIRVDPATGVAEYVNAGHPAPILWGPGRETRELGRTGFVVSPAYPDLDWDEERLELAAGDRLLAYTDGLVEARDAEGGFYGEERLRALVERECEAPLAELPDRLLAELEAFGHGRPAGDDRTLLLLERS